MLIRNERESSWPNEKIRWLTASTVSNKTLTKLLVVLVKDSGQGQQRAARQLKDAAEGLARDRVADRIVESKQGLGNGQQQQGNGANERAIERSLNSVSERLQSEPKRA